MIVLIGIKKGTPIEIREKFNIKNKDITQVYNTLLQSFQEVAILNTCNRVEVYLKSDQQLEEAYIVDKYLEACNYDSMLLNYIFIISTDRVYGHLLELACGFHSKILGENEIIGQIRDCYIKARELGALNSDLLKLFEEALGCGKEFREKTKLYKFPVSISNIAVNKVLDIKAKSVMVIGNGKIGLDIIRGLLSKKVENIYLVVRNTSIEKIEKVEIIDYKEKIKVINKMDAIISCTAASHRVVLRDEIKDETNIKLMIDIAMPRDIDENIKNIEGITLLDVDEISKEDMENRNLRLLEMKNNKPIIEEYLDSFKEYLKVKNLNIVFSEMKLKGEEVYSDRYKSYMNKKRNNNRVGKENENLECRYCDDKDIIQGQAQAKSLQEDSFSNTIMDKDAEDEFLKVMLKSTSDYYINRAIKLLKKESLEGGEEECLRIIKEIFL